MSIAAIFAVLLAFGVPIALVLAATALAYIYLSGNTVLYLSFPQVLYGSMENYGLIAIPLFMLVGELMNEGGITRRLIALASVFIGHVRGGLAYINIVANMFLASIIGSANAQTAVMSQVMVPEMVSKGYSRGFATATTCAGALLAPIIPPSMLFVIFGVLAQVSIGDMFIAGIIPGLLIAAGFVTMIWCTATFFPHRIMTAPDPAPAATGRVMSGGEMARKSVPILLLVALILGGLYSGFFTPTEAGAVGAAGALVIALARRQLDLPKFWRVLKETGLVSAAILFLLIAAGLYSRMLSMAGVPQAIGEMVEQLGLGPYGFLAAFIVIVLLMGMILDSTSILLIMVPIGVPIAQAMGFDLIHFGVMVIIAVEMGLLTPPFGISVFTVKATLGDPRVGVETVFAGALPFVLVMGAALVLIALVPTLATALVR